MITPTYDAAGAVTGITLNATTYSSEALELLLARYRRLEAEHERMRQAIRFTLGCDGTTLCPECRAELQAAAEDVQ